MLFVGTSIIHPSTEGVFLLCNILDLLIYSIKYKLWKEDYEEARILYIEATRQYNEQMKVVTELFDRVPLDDCSTDWSTFTDDELKEAQANYQAQLTGYEQFYVDDDGNFDENALKNSSDANDYYQIKNVILPSIQIEMDNRQLPTDDDNADYVDSYKTNWKLYGLDELKVKLQEYKNTIEICKKGGYDQPYTEDSSHTKDVHDTMYAKYLDAQNQLDSNYVGGCQEAYDQRQSEIDAANEILNSYNKTRTDLVKQISKETWSGVVAADNSGYILDEAGNYIRDEAGRRIYCDTQKLRFTERDLTELSKVYYDGDYSNENMFLTDSDDQVSAIDEQLKLLDTAIDDLYIASHPQYQFTTSLDNFLALADYEDYIKNINQGDYLWLTVDNKVVKLRVVEIQYNPLIADNSIQITFSNMIQGRSSRNDLSYVLNTPSNASKSSASGSSNNFLNNEGITLTAGLIQKLISNGSFKNGVSQIINNEFAGMLAGSSISLEELNAKIIKVTDLYGKNGYFEYLQSKLITAGKIVSDSADFKELSTLAATIKSAIIGASSTETGIVINLTTENATMSEAMIKDLIAKYITVNELKAGDIYTNKIKILSENGTLRIQDNTFSIYDEDGNVVVQLGEDKNGNYGLIISDSKGSVLLDSQGLHEGIVPDDFIKTDMIADGQITESKIDKTTMRDWTMPDGSKVFDVSHLWDGDDSFGKSYNTIKSTVSATSKELGDLSDKVDQLGNGYTVVLSNETQNIPCTSDGITATSFLIEIPFYGYEGIKQAACTVVVGELPDGITLAENVDSTSTVPGKITLNVAKGKTLGNKSLLTGTIVFTCTVSGKKISKKFTWIKSLAGKDGSQGIPAPTYYTWIRYADTPTSGMSSDPTNKTYIGIAYNQTSQTPSSNYSDYQWSKFRGDDGASIKGDDGKTLYVWIKYADDAKGTNMSDAPESKTYMGMAWNKPTSKESTNAADYSWSLIKGADGKTPVKGVDYFDGRSSYLWIRYATDKTGSNMTDIPSTDTKYIGTATTTTMSAPTSASDYTWLKYVGDVGTPGKNGYIHIAYADSADGKIGFDTTVGTGKKYMGQYTDNIEADSSDPSKYTWMLVKGEDGKSVTIVSREVAYISSDSGTDIPQAYTLTSEGNSKITDENGNYIVTDKWLTTIPNVMKGSYLWTRTTVNYSDGNSTVAYSVARQGLDGTSGIDGLPGKDGKDGRSNYVHIKYSDYPNPTDDQITETPSDYIGVCVNEIIKDPDTASSYTWSKWAGSDGKDGIPGADGYVHFAYANSADGKKDFSIVEFTGATYIGVYSDHTKADSQNYKDYAWTLIKGADGKTPVKGVDYFDGVSCYIWIRYATDSKGSGMTTVPSTSTTYIGTATTQTSAAPTSASAYTWAKYVGEDGVPGNDGYIHIAYADSADGKTGFDTTVGTNKKYMGQYTDHTKADSTDPTKYTWTLIKGADGKDGKTPIKGVDYFDGISSYVWIRYATDAKGTGMTAIPSTTTGYIGTAITTTATAPTNASAYVWAKYVGDKGAKGDGGYIHIAYADSADGKTGFDTTVGTGKSYIGQYTDNIEKDSSDPTKYTWSLIKGADGKTLYTWLKYADSPTSGMSDSPSGKKYMGIAINKTSITESNNYSDYTWSLIKGTDGISVKGDKGDTVYIWVKYADDAKGNGMSEYPDGKKYIGLAYNKTTATESNNASDYIWSLIQGEDAVLYEIESSVAVIKKCTLDVCSITDESGNRIVDEQGRFLSGYFLTDSLSPNKITFTAYKQVGSKTRTTYACRFIIQESLNGLSWSTKYTSSKDETSVSYTPSTLKLQQIKCVMYRAGGITEQLDSQTVPVIQDAEGYDSVIQTFTDTFASVELKVDNNAKAIILKAEQKDITNAINNYDNTTVKDIRNRQTEQKVNIDGISSKVSDIETTMNGSADGTKTGLIEKVTQVTTKAGTIEANLKNNYTTTTGMNTQISNSIAASADKIKVTLADGKTESTLKAALGEIQKSVKDNAGNISTVTQKANSLETKVANQGNDIANLKVDAKAVETLVGSSAGTTDVVQKATDFRKTITDAAGNANLALSTANSNKNIISNMKVGAANTIRNSNDLIYDLYFMVASLRDESGNRIVAENGDYLVAYY